MKKANLWNIMKVISAHLATYALLLTSFAPVAVLANDPEPTPAATPAPEPTVDMSNMTEADIEAMTALQDEGTAANAQAEVDESNNGNSNFDEVDSTTSMWVSIISGIAIGYVASKMLRACKKLTGDMYLAAAAGIVYIYGEIKATMEDKETREEIEEAYDKCKNEESDCQYGALEAEKESYDDIKETAEEKAELHRYSAYGLAAAAAWAMGKALSEDAGEAACRKALMTATSTLSSGALPACTKVYPIIAPTDTNAAPRGVCVADVEKCALGIQARLGMRLSEEAMKKIPQPSYTMLGEVKTSEGTEKTSYKASCQLSTPGQIVNLKFSGPADNACNLADMNAHAGYGICELNATTQNQYGPHVIDPLETENLLKKWFDIKVANNKKLHALIPETEKRKGFVEFWRKAYFDGLDIFSPEAQALKEFSSYMGFAGAAVGIWLGLNASTTNTTNMFIGTPWGRATFFGAMAGVVYVSAEVTQGIADDAETNSNKIASVLNNRRNENEEGTEIERQGRERQDVVTTTGNGTAPGTVATDGASDTPPLCANGENASGGCNNIPGAAPGDTSFLNGFGGSVGASNLLAVANDVNDGSISAESQRIVSSSSDQGAIALKKLRKKKSDYFKKLKKSDPKAFEKMKKLDDYAQKAIQSGVQKVLKRNKVTPAQFLAAVGSGKIPSVKDAEKDSRVAAAASRVTGKKVGSIGLGGASGKKDWSMKFNFDEEAAKEEVTAVSGNSETMAMSEDNGKVVGSTNAEDIMGRNNNIWQEITKRYIRTAYPVLLEQL